MGVGAILFCFKLDFNILVTRFDNKSKCFKALTWKLLLCSSLFVYDINLLNTYSYFLRDCFMNTLVPLMYSDRLY